MTLAKICGLRRLDDALAAASSGADMLGFVFAPSRRRVNPEVARDIIAEVRRRALPSSAELPSSSDFSSPHQPRRVSGSGRAGTGCRVVRAGWDGVGSGGVPLMVGVFVNASSAEINRIARLCDLDVAQLSGDESNQTIHSLDLPAIKVIHVAADTSTTLLRRRAAATTAEVMLLDTARSGSYGGTGEVFDWSLLSDLGKPFLLAGGLTSGNVMDAIRIAHPWGVDVSGGVETNGDKDTRKIRDFILTVQRSRTGVGGSLAPERCD